MWDRLRRLQDVLLVQCAPHDVRAAAELADRPGAGIVVTAPRRDDIRRLARACAGRPLLVDASRYTGAKRKRASEPFDSGWLIAQRDAELPVLTDSGYLDEHDIAGLSAILDRAAALGDVIAALPLNAWWFKPAGGLPVLLDQVRAAGVPIAVALEHSKDPLGVARTLKGMLALVAVGVPVIQLRCDVSGLGLMCHGAHAAAIGTRTSLRHLYPIDASHGGGGRPAAVATIVRDCLSYVDVRKIAFAVQAAPEDSLWTPCTCPACRGRQLGFIARLPDKAQQERAAFGHALDTLFNLRDDLLSPRFGKQVRQAGWHHRCGHARARFEELEADGQRWREPPFLKNWFEVPVPARAGS